jgi:hypothetical protein
VSAAAKLGAYAFALAAVFAAALGIGSLLADDTGDRDAARQAAPAATGGHGDHGGADRPALALEVDRFDGAPGERAPLRFRVLGADGEPVTRFAVEHERRMHLIVVRRDATRFQHLHPTMRDDGTWEIPIRFSDPGTYRVFADFRTGEDPVTLHRDLRIGAGGEDEALPEPRPIARTDAGHEVRLDAGSPRAGAEASLRFAITREGRAVHTEPYLGAGGHLVALREGDLEYLHTHPADHGHGDEGPAHDDAVRFATEFPSEGRYRLFLQFKDRGRVHTAAFTTEVDR